MTTPTKSTRANFCSFISTRVAEWNKNRDLIKIATQTILAESPESDIVQESKKSLEQALAGLSSIGAAIQSECYAKTRIEGTEVEMANIDRMVIEVFLERLPNKDKDRFKKGVPGLVRGDFVEVNNDGRVRVNNHGRVVEVYIINLKKMDDTKDETTSRTMAFHAISRLTALQELGCYNNNLSELKVNNLAALQRLYCSYNNLHELNVDNLAALQGLYCQNNNLHELNVDNLAALQGLNCSYNLLPKNVLAKLQKLYKQGRMQDYFHIKPQKKGA